MNPYLSFCGWGAKRQLRWGFLGRLQVFVNALLAMWERHALDAELVIVEWNPPADRLPLKKSNSLAEILDAGQGQYCRSAQRSSSAFSELESNAHLRVHCQNVGIRRAKGEFILSTNPDILFSDHLMRCFAERNLEQNAF